VAELTFKSSTDWVRESWGYETLQEGVETSPSNESSVVQLAEFNGRRIVLTGDAGPIGLEEAANYAGAWLGMPGLELIQMPHHGSRHNVTPSVLNRWLGMPALQGEARGVTAVVSAADKDPDHPRKQVVNAFIRRGCQVFSTEGNAVRHHRNMAARVGWVPLSPISFSDAVEA